MPVQTISVSELNRLHDLGEEIELLDVRTPVEFRACHVSYARNIPLDALDPTQIMQARNGSSQKPLYLICRTGNRSEKACQRFAALGLDNVFSVDGGVTAWEQHNLPVVRGKKAVSLERQVRIAAGLLVLIGTILGVFLHPWILLVPAFVGAGLAFAGITDTCGMAMLLAKMPWNQVKNAAESHTGPGATCCG